MRKVIITSILLSVCAIVSASVYETPTQLWEYNNKHIIYESPTTKWEKDLINWTISYDSPWIYWEKNEDGSSIYETPTTKLEQKGDYIKYETPTTVYEKNDEK